MADNNVLLTTETFARLVLFDMGRMLNVARNMTRSIDGEFAKGGYKPGDHIQVRKPYRFVGGDGLAWDPEPLVDQVTTITVNNVPHVHFKWDSINKTLKLREAMKLYTRPAAIAMASKINALCATFAANNALNSVGTPGTAPTSVSTYLSAGDILVEQGLPDNEDLKLIVNRRMSSAFVNATTGFFNPTAKIGTQYNKGRMENAFGYEVSLDQTINTHTNGTFAGTPLCNSATAQQAEGGNNATMSLITDGWSSGATSLKVGDKFTLGSATSATVGGVNSVHPQTRQSTGRQQVFTVQADISDTTGAITMVIAPAITPSGQYQNVDTAAVDNAIITVIGATGVAAQQGLLLHENAFAFVTVPIHEPEAGMGAKVEQFDDPDTGLTISHVAYFDGDTGEERHKFQSLVGVGNLYREMCCVIQG